MPKFLWDEYINIHDGSRGHIELPGGTLLEQVSNAAQFVNCEKGEYSCHAPLLRKIAGQSAVVLSSCNDWINSVISAHRQTIDIFFSDGTMFNARAGRYKCAAGTWQWGIEINLGSIARLLGCANRVLQMIENNYLLTGDYTAFGSPRSLEWDPLGDPVGILTTTEQYDLESSFRLTVQALQLVYFHEVAHILSAHPYVPVMSEPSHSDYALYRRAVESEADFGAGWLYSWYTDNHSIACAGPDEENQEQHGKELVMAAMATYIAFQLSSNPAVAGKEYHLPPTRVSCILSGAAGWFKNFSPDRGLDEFVQRIFGVSPVDFIFSQLSRQWLAPSSESYSQDKAAFENETKKRFKEIREQTAGRRMANWIIG